MITTAIFILLFGVLILVFPQFLSLLVGLFFIFLGINMLVMGWLFRIQKKHGSGISFGGYEIIRKK